MDSQTIDTQWDSLEDFEAHHLLLKVQQPHTYTDVGMVLNHLGIFLKWFNENRNMCRFRVTHSGVDEVWVVSSPVKLTQELLNEWASLLIESYSKQP